MKDLANENLRWISCAVPESSAPVSEAQPENAF
jgi:hypothetical protein